MKSAQWKAWMRGLALLLMVSLVGCSTFNREWKAAAAGPMRTNDIQGRWEGTWSSQTNGHHGRLRCLVRRKGEGELLARFHANYMKVLSFGYSVPLTVRPVAGAYEFQGGADLGKLAGGLYQYEGQATSNRFFSTYKAKADGGVFEMKRPEGE